MKKTLILTALSLSVAACGPALPDPCDPPMDIKHRAMCDDNDARVASDHGDKGDAPTKRPGNPEPKPKPTPKPKPDPKPEPGDKPKDGDGKVKPKPTGDGSKGDGDKKPKGDGKGKPKGDNGNGGGDGAPGKSPHGDGGAVK